MDAKEEQGGRLRWQARPALLLASPQGADEQGECPSSSERGCTFPQRSVVQVGILLKVKCGIFGVTLSGYVVICSTFYSALPLPRLPVNMDASSFFFVDSREYWSLGSLLGIG